MIHALVTPIAPEPASSSKAAVRPLLGGPDLTPHLVPIEHATPGDLVAMVGGHYANFEEGGLEVHLEAFYVQGGDGLEVVLYDKLPKPATDHAAHLVAEQLFLAKRPHEMLLSHEVVEDSIGYQVQSVHFADAVLLVNTAWLQGELQDDDLVYVRPVLFVMEAAPDLQVARDRAARAAKYLDVFRRMLPAHLRDEADWDSVLPEPEAFLVRTRSR